MKPSFVFTVLVFGVPLLLLCAAGSPIAQPLQASVVVNSTELGRSLPSDVIGSNINFINNGSGILSGNNLTTPPYLTKAFASLGLGAVRFPGGSLSQFYNWWNGIGPKNLRPTGFNDYTGGVTDNNYGTDEHAQFCAAIGAKASITVNFGTGTPLTAANWVEYCNSPVPPLNASVQWKTTDFHGNQSAPRGYFAWLRGQYGHPAPYNVSRWEVGNEVYDPWTNTYNASQYATRFLKFLTAMKAIDSSIKVAVIGYDSPDGTWGTDKAPWNLAVAAIAGAAADAVHVHMYGPVGDDGQTVYAAAPFTLEQSVTFAHKGLHTMWVTASGWNPSGGHYPSNSSNTANLAVFVNSLSVGSLVVPTASPRLYAFNISIAAPGTFTIGIQVPNASPTCAVQWLYETLFDFNGLTVATAHFRSQSDAYRAVMSLGNFRGEQSKNISTIFHGKDVWVTEFNTLYNLAGFGIYQPTLFLSAIAMSDMALNFVINGGASNVEQWSSLNDFYFSLLLDATRAAPSSSAIPLSLLASCFNGNGTRIAQTTIKQTPHFAVNTSLGNIPIQAKPVASLDVAAVSHTASAHAGTGYVSEIAIVAINKDLDSTLNTSFAVVVPLAWSGPNGVTVKMSIVSTLVPDAISLNSKDSAYVYSPKPVAGTSAITIDSPQHYLLFNGHGLLCAEHGTVEFWLRPTSWTLGAEYPILSFGDSFQLVQAAQGALFAVWADDVGKTAAVYSANSCDWSGTGFWQHVALTWNILGNLSLYVNGTLAMTTSLGGNMHPFFDKRQPIYFGSSIASTSLSVNASFDELRFSNKTRTANEISADFAYGVKGMPLVVDNWTTALFHFDGTVASSVNDQATIVMEKTMIVSAVASPGQLVATFSMLIPRCSLAVLHVTQSNASVKTAPPPSRTTLK